MASSPSSKKMTLKSSDVEVADAVAASGSESQPTLQSSDVEVRDAVAATESQPVKHLDLSGKLTEPTSQSDGDAPEVEELLAALESLELHPNVERGKAPLRNVSSKITLRSSDGKLFEVEEAVAWMSETIKHIDKIDGVVSLPRVSSEVLEKVIEYCNKHVDYPDSDASGVNQEIKNWDTEFLKMDLETLTYLVLAANYLKLNSLQDLACKALTRIIKGKSPEWIREVFKMSD